MFSDIDELVGMKPIYGTTAARKKARLGKEGKVTNLSYIVVFVGVILNDGLRMHSI